MRILGYSERGIINSLIFSIGEDMELMNQFIGLIDLPKTFQLGTPKDYTVLLEQSFSRFGDADLIIIIHYKKPEDKKVLFIEAKVKTLQGNWILQTQYDKYIDQEQYEKKERYKGYSSNLFFQLHLKKLLIDYSTVYNGLKEEEGIEEPKFGDIRKIGNNKIVLDAFELLKDSEAFYIGLIPSKEKEIEEFTKENETGLHFLAWEKVHEFCKDNEKLEKVLGIFGYNKGQIYEA
ncbi:MAG: hypothetical protein COB98_01645 [Flavobacteriaceae bacterium]|nr:MAG: hypothetical protein COB98_01645 [Flavobacteriaceae bacterium]